MKENAIGESYYRLAIFCFKHSTSGLITNKFETNKLLIKTILRGMRYESKNARLQFPRLLQLSNINANELCDIFNEEVYFHSYKTDSNHFHLQYINNLFFYHFTTATPCTTMDIFGINFTNYVTF